jgi:hypothetical protein
LNNSELQQVLDKLESLEDEELAVELLKEFDSKTKALGQLLMNLDPELAHDEWKSKCAAAKEEVDKILEKISDY